jgi:hypothetical protein
MRASIAIILISGLLLGACTREGSRCDDGGDGGVVIDGTCL